MFLFVLIVIISISSAFFFGVIYRESTNLTVIGFIILSINVLLYSLTAIVNPGIPDRNMQKYEIPISERKETLEYCAKCNIVRKAGSRTYHCADCDVCVEGYDHHCPWTGKCIGKGNVIYFYLFLLTTIVLLVYFMISCILTLPY